MEEKNTTVKKESVPIWEKYALTIYEAAEYFNIGEHRLRQLVRENRQADSEYRSELSGYVYA